MRPHSIGRPVRRSSTSPAIPRRHRTSNGGVRLLGRSVLGLLALTVVLLLVAVVVIGGLILLVNLLLTLGLASSGIGE